MDRLQMAKHIAAACLVCAALPAAASEGIKIDLVAGFWSGQSDKLRVNALWLAASSGPQRLGGGIEGAAPLAASVLGDYYFSPSPTPQLFGLGGFRASSGLLIRQPGISLSDLALSSRSAATFGLPSHLRLDSVASPLADTGLGEYSTLPYVGVGYSGIHAKSGWGFWADVGLVARNPGNALGFGRVLSGTQSAEDLVRDLRLTPLVQLGVNYSF
ncbi:MAG: hypothetical protein ABIR94_08950 [Rubrivivax sp.]